MNKAYEIARTKLGMWEFAEGSNPKIVEMYKDVGHPEVKDDSVSWCGAFVGSCIKASGLGIVDGPLGARNWLRFGEVVAHPRKGDIVVFWRESPNSWKGHVAFVEELQGDNVLCLGGNQKNQVNITPYSKERVLGYRRHKTWFGQAGKEMTHSTSRPATKPVETAPAKVPAKQKDYSELGILGVILAVLSFLAIKFFN